MLSDFANVLRLVLCTQPRSELIMTWNSVAHTRVFVRIAGLLESIDRLSHFHQSGRMAQTLPINAVIFDMDGVLTDSEPLINAAAVEMFREKGLTVRPDDFLPFVGTGEDRYLSGVAEVYHFPLEVPAAKKRTYEIYLSLVPEKLQSFQGAIGLVWACRQAGLKVAVASSADLVKIQANLNKIGLPVEFWDTVVSAEDVVNKKPAPDIFLAAAEKLRLPPAQCAVVEDAVNGVQAARAAGMRCVAVAHTFSADRLQEADLVRPGILQVTVNDLVTPGIAGSSAIVPLVEPNAEPPRKMAWGFWATLGFMALIAIGVLGAQLVVGFGFALVSAILHKGVDVAGLESNGLFLSLATTASSPAAVGLAWLFASLRKGLPAREYLGLLPVCPRRLLGGALVIIAFVLASDTLTILLKKPVIPEFMRDIYGTAGFLPLLWLVLVVIAPITEEVLFRGFMFQGVSRSPIGVPGAIVLTSLTWAAIHLQYDLYGMAMVFVGGLVLGVARARTGSLFPCILMHSVMNLIATMEVVLQERFGLFPS